jgi:Gamma-butyrobetaine hydroxylase-like, N-terminal
MLIKSVRIVQSVSKLKIGETLLKTAIQQGPQVGNRTVFTQPAALSGHHLRKYCTTKQPTNTYDGASATSESNPHLLSLKLNAESRRLELVCATDLQLYKFPFVWLRDNCQCSECFHKESQSRTIDWEKFDVNVRAVAAKVSYSQNRPNSNLR